MGLLVGTCYFTPTIQTVAESVTQAVTVDQMVIGGQYLMLLQVQDRK